ncbi:hypothetical protein ACQ4PT_038751 [Festuca glaucescens]
MVARSPLDPARVPTDRHVFVYHCGIHLVIFVLILALNREVVTVEQQVALMQDLFLLPQVIGNAVWRVNCMPLKGSLYFGVTAVRLLPHVYDYMLPTATVVGARYSGERQFVDAASGGRLFAKADDVVVPLAAVTLVLVVHAQQRWNYAIVNIFFISCSFRIQEPAVDMASIAQFIVVILLHLCIASSSLQFDPLRLSEEEHDYLFADVTRHCQSVLSSATELPYDTNHPDNVKNQPFEKGDWRQDAGKAPLVPFDDGEAPKKGARRLPDPLSLATFVRTHVDGDSEHRARAAAVNVSGVLVLTVARKNAVPDLGPHISVVSPGFNLSAGSTRLQITFEGVYTERSKGDNGNDAGERVLCMVGRAVLPKRNTHGVDPWDWAKNSGRSSFQPPVTADNNILLVLRTV